MDSHGPFEEELARLALELRTLRIKRGNPSYRRLEARAEDSGTGLRVPVATQSDAFRGKRLLGFDALMALVRILHSYDGFGRETAIPPHNSKELEPWRERWRLLAALQPPVPARDRTRAPIAAPPSGPVPHPLPALPPVPAAAPAPAQPLPADEEFTLLHRLEGHTGAVRGLAFATTSPLLASGADDKTVRLWDCDTGSASGEPLTGHIAPVLTVAFSPDGEQLVGLAETGNLRTWKADGTDPHGSFVNAYSVSVFSICFTRDGRLLGTDYKARRAWNLDTGRPAGPTRPGPDADTALLSPDGSRMVTVPGGTEVVLWDVATGRPVHDSMSGHRGDVLAIAFSPDGLLLATGGLDGTVRLWDTATGQSTGTPLTGHTGAVRSVAFSADGRLLASTSDDRTARVWEHGSRRLFGRPLTAHGAPVTTIAFSPDGKLLATASRDHTVLVYRLAPVPEVRPLATRALAGALRAGHTVPLPALAARTPVPLGRVVFSPTGNRLLAAAADNLVLAWNPVSRDQLHDQTLRYPPATPWGLVFPGGGERAEVRSQTSERAAFVPGRVSLVKEVAFTPDGRFVAMVGADGLTHLWDSASDAPVGGDVQGQSQDVNAVAFSPDGRMLAVAVDETVELWNPDTRQLHCRPLTGHRKRVRALVFAPDGLLASGDTSGAVRLWFPDGTPHGEPLVGHPRWVHDLAFAPDGRLLAVAGNDGVQLWDPATGESLGAPLARHASAVHGVAFSPDGSLLAASCADGAVRLWLPPVPKRTTARPL
ncbi:WD40 repeat domain-containing protein [Streptomyces sp. NPDC060028]|uniref:WD40 repeat domain-containing protein n=1 Tax=Streptomyces sp. NPDC060028 TaxID=3347041 RepID=UPI003673CD8A